MQKITPSIWFANEAEDAARFYTPLFANGTIGNIMHYDEASAAASGQPEGSVLLVEFEIEGMTFQGLNGGPIFTPNPSISFIVRRDTKEEIDTLWEALGDGGKELMPLGAYPFSEYYGWVQDKYGISWQLILPNQDGEWRPEIVPSLLFVTDTGKVAEDAITFYTSLFDDAQIGTIIPYPAGMEPNKEGAVMYSDFTLAGQWFAAMDASASQHDFAFSEGISFAVNCTDQSEVDYFWEALSAEPEAERCGWLKDKYGVSWQIVPRQLIEMITSQDTERTKRAMEAMMQMKKIDIAALEAAYNGEQ